MKTLKYVYIVILLAAFFSSCSKMDEYKKFTNGKEILYMPKADSVKLYPGRNRVKLSWRLIADPKIVKTKIYWNNRTKYLDVPVNTNVSGARVFSVIVPNLEEGNYNFELFNFDMDGNSSIASLVSGSVYGNVYENALLSRVLKILRLEQDGSSSIGWLSSESSSVGVELSYLNKSGLARKFTIPAEGNTTLLPDYDYSQPLSYRTIFLPDSNAIDTFYSAIKLQAINEIALKNAGSPFKSVNVPVRWGILQDWITTDPVKNQSGLGGFDNNNTAGAGFLSFEYWGSNAAINNGKIFQTLILDPGSYRFVSSVSNLHGTCEATYASVALGNSLPDVNAISGSLGSYRLTNNSLNGKDITVSFVLTERKEVALGFVATMSTNRNTSLRISKVRLFKD